MAMSTPRPTAMVLMALTWTLLLLTPPAPVAAWLCGDVPVDETAGEAQPDGSKRYHVTVANRGPGRVWDVHLDCGARFEPVRPVEPSVLHPVKPKYCLLLNGGAIGPGAKVTFTYTSNIRYSMALVRATC